MTFDIAIIGGGIVGLATGLTILKKKPHMKVAIIEKEKQVAKHQTGNNSGVIHSGLYYKPGSLKAKNCIRGYQMLIDFCKEEGVPYEITGKVVVATKDDQIPLLTKLLERGLENGLQGSRAISISELKEYEPYCTGVAALHVPQTGIVDYKLVAETFANKFLELGGQLFLGCEVLDIVSEGTLSTVMTTKDPVDTRLLVNCAGLYADKIAEMQEKNPIDIRIIPFRGEYYKLKKDREYLVNNLIYPVPDPNFPFLGVHFTRMAKGGVEAGPNAVLAFKKEGYKKSDFNYREFMDAVTWPGFQKVAAKYWKTGMGEYYRSFSKHAFTKALQQLIPDVQSSDLIPGGAGVRAQACDRNGGLLDDFAITENKRCIHVLNAPSPAATSSLSIGEAVTDLVLKRFG
ncbi:L-2-hydroxyglutarate oxidase [Lunatibacter salilacus]|uniref:L-2-hydroxyglutarate oxidase n=1 Tax=Lunatibacter salilacus TaxID=2483804 RepID=UPI00131AEA1E|nr:L-2-hydroxyglutarate oxidase [Lunatibacter salilacus]